MTKEYFEELMAGFGCKTIGNMALGAAGVYPYSAELESSSPLAVEFGFVAHGKISSALSYIKSLKQPHLKWSITQSKGTSTLCCTMEPPSDFYAKAEVHTLLHTAKKALEKYGCTPPDKCLICGSGGCDALAYIEGYRPVHSLCLKTRLDLPEQDETVHARPETISYFTGFAGALMGALIGAMPSLFQIIGSGRINTLMYAFIPIISALFYRLARGKKNQNFAAVAVLASSLGAAFLLEQIGYWAVISDFFSYEITFSSSIQNYLANHSFSGAVKQMMFSLAFLLVGYFASTILLRRYAAQTSSDSYTRRGAKFALASETPINQAHVPEEKQQGGPNDEPL